MDSILPTALTRDSASGDAPRPKRKGPTAEQFAMMTPSQLKSFYQSRGEWPERDTTEGNHAAR